MEYVIGIGIAIILFLFFLSTGSSGKNAPNKTPNGTSEVNNTKNSSANQTAKVAVNDIAKPKPEPEPEPKSAEPKKHICAYCGAQVEAEDMFCMECGHEVKK